MFARLNTLAILKLLPWTLFAIPSLGQVPEIVTEFPIDLRAEGRTSFDLDRFESTRDEKDAGRAPDTAVPIPDVLGDPSEAERDASYLVRLEKTRLLAAEFTGEAELVIDSGGFLGEISDVAIRADGKYVAAAGDKVVRVWEVRSGELVATLRGDMSRTSYGNCHAVAFSPDGERLLVGVTDYAAHGSIREYSTKNFGEITRLIDTHTTPCRRIAFARSGDRRVSADADGNLQVVKTEGGQITTIPVRNPDRPVFDSLAFPDAADDYLIAIDFEGPQIYAPDGRRLTAA